MTKEKCVISEMNPSITGAVCLKAVGNTSVLLYNVIHRTILQI